MEFINHTHFPALLFRSSFVQNKMLASLAIKVTYDINEGKMTKADRQVWECFKTPTETAYGIFESDYLFKKGGVDVFVMGNAHAPNGRPTKRMLVSVKIAGKIDNTLMVIGNRYWKRGFMGLQMTDPEPFVTMPINLEHAFGGESEFDELKFPYGVNPKGKGFVWEKEKVDGVALPNVEHPNNLIANWNDRPSPVGFGPIKDCERKVLFALEEVTPQNPAAFDPIFFNAAFFEMIAKEILPEEQIQINGMNPSGVYKVSIPNHQLSVALQFGDKEFLRAPKIEQVGIIVAEDQAFITYRYSFQYEMRPKEKRLIQLKEENHVRL